MKKIILEITDEEERILLSEMVDVKLWLAGLLRAKIQQVTGRLIEEHTDRNPRKLLKATADELLRRAPVESAAEKAARRLEEI